MELERTWTPVVTDQQKVKGKIDTKALQAWQGARMECPSDTSLIIFPGFWTRLHTHFSLCVCVCVGGLVLDVTSPAQTCLFYFPLHDFMLVLNPLPPGVGKWVNMVKNLACSASRHNGLESGLELTTLRPWVQCSYQCSMVLNNGPYDWVLLNTWR